MDESTFRQRLTAVCDEMIALGKDRRFPFDELELIVPLKASELTADPHIARLIMHLCENVAVQSRHYAGGMDEPQNYAMHKIDGIVSRLFRTGGAS
jgi:hypothetical protein